MVKTLIELMLGSTGRFLIDQYNQYHILINLMVLPYGALLIWAHTNLRRLTRNMESVMIELAAKIAPPVDAGLLFQKFSSEWKSSRANGRFLIPSRNDLWFILVDSSELIEVLNLKKEYIHVVLDRHQSPALNGNIPINTFRAWEIYRHQLLTGVRSHHLEPETQLKMRNK